MAKDIIPHFIHDWSKIDEREGFWGRVDLMNPEVNFGIHRYNNNLWTSGLVGVGRLYDRNNLPIQDNGKEHILIVSSNYGLDPWHMLETVMLDEEYDVYIDELNEENRFLFKIFYDQSLICLPQGSDIKAELLFALSYVNSCHALCRKGLKKSLIHHEENMSAKLRGKIDINKNIKHNTARGRSDKFYCRYVDFTEDSIENRIIKSALIKCQGILKESFRDELSVRGKIAYCLNCLRRVKRTRISNIDFNSTNIGGLYSYYKPVIQQARAILNMDQHNQCDDITSNSKTTYTIPYLINMETLFEYYARTELKKILAASNYRVENYSKKYYLQKGIENPEDAEKGIHLMQYCIPDIIVFKDDKPVAVIDAKYKLSGRSNRYDSHQLLAYVLLTGVDKCGFILPGDKTTVREMSTTEEKYLPLSHGSLRYYELLLGTKGDSQELKSVFM